MIRNTFRKQNRIYIKLWRYGKEALVTFAIRIHKRGKKCTHSQQQIERANWRDIFDLFVSPENAYRYSSERDILTVDAQIHTQFKTDR